MKYAFCLFVGFACGCIATYPRPIPTVEMSPICGGDIYHHADIQEELPKELFPVQQF